MADASNGTGLREHVLVFSRFLRSPRTVGALTASSRALAAAMVRGLDLARARRVVELGPGTGALTGAIVDRLGPDTDFLAVDIEPAFIDALQKRWPSVQCVCASAERLHTLVTDRGMCPVDHIVSGLPFVSLPPAMTRQILANVARVLRPNGTFTTFQYLHSSQLPSAIDFRRRMSALLGGRPEIRVVMRNVPPALVLTWRQGVPES
jgi:phospholipid N-methyltransferase